ncbi:hypothetical protein P4S70_13455 [Enterovibrio sp. Hal110]
MIELIDGKTLTRLPDGSVDFHSKAVELMGDEATEETLLIKSAELESQYLQESSYLTMSQVIEERVYLYYSAKQQSQDEKMEQSFYSKNSRYGCYGH